MHLLVHVVRDEEVDLHSALLEAAQNGEHRRERRRIEPVVGVDDLVVRAGRLAQAREHRDTVSAVLLMHGADDVRVARHPFVRFGGRLVLAAVVDDDDLNVLGKVAPLEDRRDAVVHIGGRVVARNGEGDDLMHGRK